jgi:hypothetical protein
MWRNSESNAKSNPLVAWRKCTRPKRRGGSTPQVFEQILATTKAIRLDLGLKMLKQNKGLYMVTNDGQTKCQEHPMKEEIQIGERRLELSPLLCE